MDSLVNWLVRNIGRCYRILRHVFSTKRASLNAIFLGRSPWIASSRTLAPRDKEQKKACYHGKDEEECADEDPRVSAGNFPDFP